nr:cytidine deaminase [uncultured Tyzzerella sp.]
MKELVKKALEAQKFSYSPYSNFQVGAALLTKSGKIYTGCNIENAAYSPTNCAERTAFFKAISEGETTFEAIAIVGSPKDCKEDEREYCAPCGVCRQVMAEFCNIKDFKVILGKSEEDYKLYTLEEILPLAFTKDDL